MTGILPDDPGTPKDLRAALDKSRDRIVDLSRAASAKRVLDWPTGPGYCLRSLANHVAPETLVVALEVNLRMLAWIKPYYDEKGFTENMLFVAADARRMPFKDGVFQSVTALGGSVEIAEAEAGVRETYRVLNVNGWFALSGEQYREDSPSMKVAERLGFDSLATKNRLQTAMQGIGFKNLQHEVLYEGYDIDPVSTPDEERCPLPAPSDWFQTVVASGQK
jgi:SAM-dependent methyltransferase